MKRITALLTLFLAMTFISCKSGKTVGENPFFAEWETPYGVPPFDKIEPEHFLPAIERGMSLHDAEIDAITSNNDAPTFENVILAYDRSGRMLAQTELIFGMLCAAENTPEMQALQERVMPLLAAHADKILLNEKLFERVKAVYDRRGALELDAEQSRLLEKTYRDFVRAGALLDAEQKARLKAINGEYIRKMSPEAFAEKAIPYIRQVVHSETADLQLLCHVLQPRTELFTDIPEQVDFIDALPDYDVELYRHKKMKTTPETAKEALAEILPVLEGISDWTVDGIHAAVFARIGELGVKNGWMLWPLRTALSGKPFTPGGGIELCAILGKDETLKRVQDGINRLS